MARVLLALKGPLFGPNGEMAGAQVRVFEMARALARAGNDVSVVEETPSAARFDAIGFRIVDARTAAALPIDVWIALPSAYHRFRRRMERVPYILDGYEAPFDSFLANAAAAAPSKRRLGWLGFRSEVNQYFSALLEADYVIAANPSQRDLYRALLTVLGRIGPSRPRDDITLLLHSGTPSDLVRRGDDRAQGWQKRLSSPVFLWAGTVYPWVDIETFIDAIPAVAQQLPTAMFLFARLTIVGRPEEPDLESLTEAVAAKRVPAALAGFVSKLEPLADRIFIARSRPYGSTMLPFAVADVLVCCYHVGLFTMYSMRTRVLDSVGAGVPMVLTAGDPLAEKLSACGAAKVVPERDVQALSSTLVKLGNDGDERARMHDAALLAEKQELNWDHQVRELHNTCAKLGSARPIERRDPPLMTPRSPLRIALEEWIERLRMVFIRLGGTRAGPEDGRSG